MSEGFEWFAPKRYGYGAGAPISWHGWAVLIVYLILLGLSSLLIHYSWLAVASAVTILTASLIIIAANTTRGGWRWRWGNEQDAEEPRSRRSRTRGSSGPGARRQS